ncbi:MAG: ATP synthase F1 subunit gamma [Ruminococcaceae bacterium]|nr:ATP synthase F1 subunit gamma [Oscillospiraceae bacterium]
MGADIKKLRVRIKSVNSTLHLTKAMGLVASSKIRRANEAMNRGREYAEAVKDVAMQLSFCNECKKSPYMAKRDSERVRLVVIAGDRGLAGGYNANIIRAVRQYDNAEIIPIGKRACDRFGKGYDSVEEFGYGEAKELAEKLCLDFSNGEFDKLGIVCTRYISMMSQETETKWILPLEQSEKTQRTGIVFEPDEITVLNAMIPEYVAGMLIACAKESFACEIAARRVAMDSAGKNAQEMLDELGLEYNRARQGAITQEITEIVAGSGL